jgi:hypothetical protein
MHPEQDFSEDDVMSLKIKDDMLSLVFITLLYIGCFVFYSGFDPDEMRLLGAFPWDSSEYRRLAEQINMNGMLNLEGVYPWGPRLLFPFLYSFIESNTSLSYIESAGYLNTFSGYLVTVFSYVFLCRNGVAKFLALFISLSYMLAWLGPLRYSLYYPGGALGFETLLICILFLVLTKSQLNLRFILWGVPTVFVLTIGREVIFYITLLTILVSFLVQLINQNIGQPHSAKFVSMPKTTELIAPFLASLLGYVLAKILVKDICNCYSTIATVINYGWFHLHLGELLYPFFYALGPVFLISVTCLVFSSPRKRLMESLMSNTKNGPIVSIFALSGAIFALVGGTDSDRFILWFFPFFALFGAQAFSVIIASIRPKMLFSVLMIFVTLLWTRFYVPAIPHVFFPGEFYNAAAGVRSNLSPDLFYGPPGMEAFRLPLQKIPAEDMYLYKSLTLDRPDLVVSSQANISTLIDREFRPGSPFKGSYAYEINNIPFPLGFAHNQYELLVAHPYHGDTRVRAVLLFQWLSLLAVVCFFILKFPSAED